MQRGSASVHTELADARKLSLDDQTVRVVWQGTGLQGNYAATRDGLGDVVFVGGDHELLEDLVGVARPVRVGKNYLVAVLQLVQVPEDQVALGAGEAEAVTCYVDV